MDAATISRITVYPIKSLDGLSLIEASVTASGSILNDRRYAIFNEKGIVVNGKNTPVIHRIRTGFDQEVEYVTFVLENKLPETFHLDHDRNRINQFLSECFSDNVTLEENPDGAFLDDPEQSKFTLISTASLRQVADRFSFSMDECRRRFRANIEIDDVPAFWEENLVRPHKVRVPFLVNQLLAEGVKPCPRCVVPSRNPDNGEMLRNFQKEFITLRKESLPDFSPLPDYGNYYQLSVSCVFRKNQQGQKFRFGELVIPV